MSRKSNKIGKKKKQQDKGIPLDEFVIGYLEQSFANLCDIVEDSMKTHSEENCDVIREEFADTLSSELLYESIFWVREYFDLPREEFKKIVDSMYDHLENEDDGECGCETCSNCGKSNSDPVVEEIDKSKLN